MIFWVQLKRLIFIKHYLFCFLIFSDPPPRHSPASKATPFAFISSLDHVGLFLMILGLKKHAYLACSKLHTTAVQWRHTVFVGPLASAQGLLLRKALICSLICFNSLDCAEFVSTKMAMIAAISTRSVPRPVVEAAAAMLLR